MTDSPVSRTDWSAYEYRVRWQREGRRITGRIYQTEKAALHKAEGIAALEEVKGDTRFEDMPDLVGPPVIEARLVGEWTPVTDQANEPTDRAREAIKEWAGPPEGSSYGDW